MRKKILCRHLRLCITFIVLLSASTFSAYAADIPFFLPYPKIDTNHWYVSNGWTNGDYQSCEWRADAITVDTQNLKLTLSNHGGKIRPIGCAEIHTQSRTGYGTYATRLRSAKGSGLNTAFFTYVGPGTGSTSHDEIDFEFLGKNSTTVQVNYYVNGKSQDATIIPLGFDASADFHDYSFVWLPNVIRWYVDGKKVHETKAAAIMPSNPGRIYLQLWSGAKSMNGWLGPFTYTQPVSAEFSQVQYTPLH